MKKIILSALILATFQSNAGSLYCEGTVEKLSYHSPNKFMIKLSSMNSTVFFCNPSENWTVTGSGYSTSQESCTAMYSTFLAAKMANKTITRMLFDGDDVPESCNSWGNWPSANIRYYILN